MPSAEQKNNSPELNQKPTFGVQNIKNNENFGNNERYGIGHVIREKAFNTLSLLGKTAEGATIGTIKGFAKGLVKGGGVLFKETAKNAFSEGKKYYQNQKEKLSQQKDSLNSNKTEI